MKVAEAKHAAPPVLGRKPPSFSQRRPYQWPLVKTIIHQNVAARRTPRSGSCFSGVPPRRDPVSAIRLLRRAASAAKDLTTPAVGLMQTRSEEQSYGRKIR